MNNFGFLLVGAPLFFYAMSASSMNLLPYWARVPAILIGVFMTLHGIQTSDD